MDEGLPPVAPAAAAGAAAELPPRLHKRLPGMVDKAGAWPVVRADGTVSVRVAPDTEVRLTLSSAGTVASASDVTCSCLLAPACLHRAAVLAAAPLAEEEPGHEEPQGAEGAEETEEVEGAGETGPPPPLLGADAHHAADALWSAGVAALTQGVTASALPRTRLLHAAQAARLAGLHRPAAGATRVARRLTEARTPLTVQGAPAGPTPEAAAAHRLADLTADLAALLDETRAVRESAARPQDAVAATRAAEAAGRPRRTYEPTGTTRLYGLFTEPVVTASGYAGAIAHLVTATGELRTVAVMLPGPPAQARATAGTRIPGGAALTLAELGRAAGLMVTGATLTEDGRIGGGSKLRSVAAPGAGWYEEPLDALWRRPVAEQVAAVLAAFDTPEEHRASGADLLFLDGTVVRHRGRAALVLADGGRPEGPLVTLHAPDERPELAYGENLRLLAARPGARVRVIGRLAPDRPTGVTVLAMSAPGGRPYQLGLDRLPPGAPAAGDPAGAGSGHSGGLHRPHHPEAPARPATGPVISGPPSAAGLPLPPAEWELLGRAVARTVAGGRALAAAAVDPALPGRLLAVGLPTAAACARSLAEATRARHADGLGALRPADPDAFATAWLAAALYVTASARAFTATAWAGTASLSPEGDGVAAATG